MTHSTPRQTSKVLTSIILLLLIPALLVSCSSIPEDTELSQVDAVETEAFQTPTAEAPAPTFRKRDGMEMVFVPEGSFLMGSNTDYDNEKPVHEVFLDAFYIDKYEVSNGQYEMCVKAGKCNIPIKTSSFSSSIYYGNPVFSEYPVINVEPLDAHSYCEWVGGSLPTEAEWEKAARGTDGRTYPWGEGIDGSRLNYCDSNCYFDWKDSAVNDGYADTAPVGSYPDGASPYGALDMAGNVWEYVSDWYQEDYYSSSPMSNPTGPENGQFVVKRGGCAGCIWDTSRSSYRFEYLLEYIDYLTFDTGFRCMLPSDTSELSSTKETQTILVADPSPTPPIINESLVVRETDGMEQVLVPAGSFMMGSEEGQDHAKPVHEVYLDAFYIDKYEVTSGQYELCVTAGACETPGDTSSDILPGYYGDSRFVDYPVVFVSWENAMDYCLWSGGRLPTEAEWEKAARGTDERMFPWGEDLDGRKANYCDSNCWLDGKDTTIDDGHAYIAPVGSFPEGASPYGALDMAGNVFEWVSDWYQEDYYTISPLSNPTGPDSGDSNIVRGGSWADAWYYLPATQRIFADLDYIAANIGFRCVSPAP